jgi:disulfide bond formation protein DsbB
MKAQMKFQKYICLAMIIVGALGLLYAFCYSTGALSELGQSFEMVGSDKISAFTPAPGKNDANLYTDIQGFNTMLMYFGIAMVLLAVLLYITASNKRRNYYVSNYVSTGLCVGGNIVLSLVALIMNAGWKSEFLNVDFAAWKQHYDNLEAILGGSIERHYSESTLWFDLGYAVYAIIIVASLALLLNLIWKVMLMRGEKKLLASNELAGGVV